MNKIVLVLMGLMMATPAMAEVKKGHQIMQYDVYAGGIHALQSKLDIDLSNAKKYEISLAAQTFGLLGRLAPWEGVFKSKGWRAAQNNKPELHQSVAIWRGDEEIKDYRYGRDGTFKSYSLKDDKNDGSPKKVDNELTQGTSDVLSATLNVLQAVAQKGECTGSTEIFDGKRRFKLNFKQKREVQLEASRYNVYEGPAVECTAMVEPVAGKWREKPRGWMSIQEQGREKGTMPTVWFAKMDDSETAVPIKVRVKTDYGTLFMHLTKYQSSGQTLALK